MIDWTLPVETTEDPPRHVRVLATDATDEHPIVTIIGQGIYSWTADGQRWRYGNNYGVSFTLRNASPPKPEAVLREAWIALYADGCASGFNKTKTGCENSTLKYERVECRRIAWMSDGSPVPSEASGEYDANLRSALEWVQKAEAERDHWKAKAEALQAEVDERNAVRKSELGCSRCEWVAAADAMRPVVDAAVACVLAGPVMLSGKFTDLIGAVRAYQSKHAPAEPVKNCTTCRFNVPIQVGAPCVKCRVFSNWESRHD